MPSTPVYRTNFDTTESFPIIPGTSKDIDLNLVPDQNRNQSIYITKPGDMTNWIRFRHNVNFKSTHPGITYSLDLSNCMNNGLEKCAGMDTAGLSLEPSDSWCNQRHDGWAYCSPTEPGKGCLTAPERTLMSVEQNGVVLHDIYANLKECSNVYTNLTLSLCRERKEPGKFPN